MLDVFFDYKTGKFGGADFELRKSLWRETFSLVDIDKQLLRMANWLLDHASHPKKNIARFVTNWLRKDQDDAELIQKNAKRPPVVVKFHGVPYPFMSHKTFNNRRNEARRKLGI